MSGNKVVKTEDVKIYLRMWLAGPVWEHSEMFSRHDVLLAYCSNKPNSVGS